MHIIYSYGTTLIARLAKFDMDLKLTCIFQKLAVQTHKNGNPVHLCTQSNEMAPLSMLGCIPFFILCTFENKLAEEEEEASEAISSFSLYMATHREGELRTRQRTIQNGFDDGRNLIRGRKLEEIIHAEINLEKKSYYVSVWLDIFAVDPI